MFQAPQNSPVPLSADNVLLAEAVEHARAGDEAAFDMLYQFYHRQICTYLARMVGNDEEGCDLAQETFLKAWRALAHTSDDLQFKAWLYRIATNTAIDYLRHRKITRLFWKGQSEKNDEQAAIAGPEEQIAETEHIKLALARLSPKYRACLLLQIEGGLTQREIAALLNIHEKSVSVYVKRGCDQFRLIYQHLANERNVTQKRRFSP
ncbi:MAG: RNA polymerase sigma factor [Ktedonobacteraceae bacterium]